MLFDDVSVPTVDLGGGATLHDLQWALLYADWDSQVARLTEALGRLLRPTDDHLGDQHPSATQVISPRAHEQQTDRVQRARELLSDIDGLRDHTGRLAMARDAGEPVDDTIHAIGLLVERIQRMLDLVRLEHQDWGRLADEQISELLLPFDNIASWQHHLDPNHEQLEDQLVPLADVADLIHKAELGIEGSVDYLLGPQFEGGRQLPASFR